MAKINVPTRAGALFELLKNKGMTQVDAHQKTGVDRKTMLKINRGGPVKLEKLQQLANKLQVSGDYFRHPPTGEVTPNAPEEPGTVMLRKLDAARLEKLLREADRIQ